MNLQQSFIINQQQITIQNYSEKFFTSFQTFCKIAKEETLNGYIFLDKIDLKSDQKSPLIAIVNDQIIGYLELTTPFSNHPNLKHIGQFGIILLKEYWNQGLGTLMIQKLEEIAKQMGITKLESNTHTNNLQSVIFCKKNGYTIEGLRTKAVLFKDQFQDEFYIAKSI